MSADFPQPPDQRDASLADAGSSDTKAADAKAADAKAVDAKPADELGIHADVDASEQSEFDLDARVLCPDGNCVGVIGLDGRCKICGLHAGTATATVDEPAATTELPATIGTTESGESGEAVVEDQDADVASDIASRQLCSDGNCVGVIGADGRCKVCGLPASA